MITTYHIHQYPVYDANHPNAPLFTDPRSSLVKNYSYIYTGKNIDIVDLKIDFNTTWYNAITSYNNQFPSGQTTRSTGLDTVLSDSGTLLISPQLLVAAGIIPAVPSLTPLRYKSVQVDSAETAGFNLLDDPNKQISVNVLKSLYSKIGGDMLTVTLQIVGDPSLLKQDDWVFSPSPTTSAKYNNWDTVNNYDFYQQYGFIRMDTGALFVQLVINTPIDIDTDINNTGLILPQPGMLPSLFSGYYKILKIKSTFRDGKFEQQLSLVRHINDEWIKNSAPANTANARPAASTSQSNQNSIQNVVQNNVGNQATTNNVLMPPGTATAAINPLQATLTVPSGTGYTLTQPGVTLNPLGNSGFSARQ